jgi:coproporphyrinogen III oxidase
VILAIPAWRLLEKEDQREREERQNHQQFEVVDVSNDLRLQCDGSVERGAPGGGERTPQMRDGRVFEQAVDRGDVTGDFGMIFLVLLTSKAEVAETPML